MRVEILPPFSWCPFIASDEYAKIIDAVNCALSWRPFFLWCVLVMKNFISRLLMFSSVIYTNIREGLVLLILCCCYVNVIDRENFAELRAEPNFRAPWIVVIGIKIPTFCRGYVEVELIIGMMQIKFNKLFIVFLVVVTVIWRADMYWL